MPQTRKDGTALLFSAIAFAADRHRDQRRKDAGASPYINHPIALARVLAVECGVTDTATLAAAILHDTIEDTKTTRDDLEERFGKRIAGIVAEVTDDKRQRKHERKAAQIRHANRLSRQAKLVKLADKICNLRDVADSPPANWPLRRRREYFEWSRAVVAGMRGTHPKLERLFDLAYSRKP